MAEREGELDSIRSALQGDDFVGAVLTGDAGVGKTTLARLATSTVGGNIRWVAGTESARSIPLGVFAHMVGVYTAHDPVTFMAAAREALLADGHTIIGVDDAHLLDQLSATLLLQLTIDKAAHIVCTVRSGVPVPDAVTSLWKDGHLLRIDLSPFTQRQSVELVESMLGGQLEGFTANLMWESSGGNALFLRHLVEGALEAGTLRQVKGVWQLRGRAAVTSELAALLEDRVEQLPEPVLRVLELLTFCEPIDLDVLAELAGEEAVETAESRSLIRIVENSHQLLVRYNHPLFGEVIRRRLGIASARRLRGRLYSSLRERPINSSADLELFEAAAADAIGLSNLPLGERFARAAVERRGGVESADLLARALLWQGHRIEAERTLAAFDPEKLTQAQLARWGCTRVSNLLWSMGDADRADEVLRSVRSRAKHPRVVAITDALASACAAHENKLDEAFALAEPIMNADSAPPWAVWWAAFGGGLALALMGKGDAARQFAGRGHAIEHEIDGLNKFMSTHAEVLALTFTGDLEAAQRCASSPYTYTAPGQYLAWGMSRILQGTVDVAQGQFPRGIDNLEQALAALTAEGAAAWMFPARIRLAEAYSALGRASEAAESINLGRRARRAARRRLRTTTRDRQGLAGRRRRHGHARHPPGPERGGRRRPLAPARHRGHGATHRRALRRPQRRRASRRSGRPRRRPPGPGPGPPRGRGGRPRRTRIGCRRRQSPRRRLRWGLDPGVAPIRPAPPPHRPRTRNRQPGRRGPVQPPDRRPPDRLRPHRRGPPLPRLHQTRRHRPRSPGRTHARRVNFRQIRTLTGRTSQHPL